MNKLFKIRIIQPKFDELYKEYKEKDKLAFSSKKSIGILNKGINNKFIDNKFSSLDIGIQDEGENTLASGNKFLNNKLYDNYMREPLYKRWWMCYLVYPVISGLVLYLLIFYISKF